MQKITLRLIYTLALLVLLSVVCYADDAAQESSRLFEGAKLVIADTEPPIVAAADVTEEYGQRVSRDIEIYDGSDYYLFLPSSSVQKAVKLRYTGDYKLYDENTGKLYPPETVITRDLSSGQFRFYEYNESSNTFYRHEIKVMSGANNAAVYIDLVDGDTALKRINSSHSDVEHGQITVSDFDGSLIYNGELTRMKGHGLTSYDGSGRLNTKNSYNINIGTKAELIEGAGKSKKWCMLKIRTNGNYDATGMSYPLGFYTFDALVGPNYFNMVSRYVDVYINNEYRGVYILTERMDINGSMELHDQEQDNVPENPQFTSVSASKKKTDALIKAGIRGYSYCRNSTLPEGVTDITGGYVLEIMCGTYGECGFLTREGMFINIKAPECPTKEQVQYIAGYVQAFEDALFSPTGYNSYGKHYTEYCDLRSYAAQTLAYTFWLNWEIYRTSTYIHKDVDGGEHSVLTFGPAWDFETGPNVMNSDPTLFGTTFSYTVEQQYIWFEQIWQKGAYVDYFATMNNGMKEIFGDLLGSTDNNRIFNLTMFSASIDASQQMNWIRWKQPDTFERRAAAMIGSVSTRYQKWFADIWNEAEYLLGVSCTSQKNADGTYTLKATARGKAESYQWYKLGEDMIAMTEIAGATESEYICSGDDDTYICLVKGQNNAYWSGATAKIFGNKIINMYTDPIKPSDVKSYTPAAYTLGEAPVKTEKIAAETEAYIETEAPIEADGIQTLADINAEEIKPQSNGGYIAVMIICILLSASAAYVFGVRYKREGGEENA